jgi:hypothetical protein
LTRKLSIQNISFFHFQRFKLLNITFKYTAKSKILSKKKIIVSSKTWLEVRYQVNFVIPGKRVYLKQVRM